MFVYGGYRLMGIVEKKDGDMTSLSSIKPSDFSAEDKAFGRQWMLALFGTAIGAGVLFLPINAGLGGVWPLIVMTILVGPMTFLAHRGFARFVMSSASKDGNVIDAVNEHFGKKVSIAINIGYFLAIFPILMIYGIGITNTVSSMMVHQLKIDQPPRGLLSFALVAGLVSIMCFGQRLVLKITNGLVYPLIAILFAVSIFLVPQWNMAQFDVSFSPYIFLKTTFLTIPVLVFAFNHSPAISSFVRAHRKRMDQRRAEIAIDRVLTHTSCALLGFTMFFVFSCVLTLTPEQLQQAKADNISVLSAFAQGGNAGLFGWLTQIVAIIAIASSFFGHYMGAHEGLNGLLSRFTTWCYPNDKIKHNVLSCFSMLLITAMVWLVAYIDVSVMDLIEAMVAPVIAIILFIMPVIAMRLVPSMSKYKSAVDFFTAIMGSIAITGFIFSHFL